MNKPIDINQEVEQAIDKKYFTFIKRIRRKIKLLTFLLTYLILFIAIISIGGYLIYNNQFTFNNSTFNPDKNLNNWNDYYDKHQKDHHLINLNDMIAFLNSHNINIAISSTEQKQKNLNFNYFMTAIDNELISNPVKQVENSNIDSDNDNLLPNGFEQNVIYNPAVNFTIHDRTTGKDVDAQNYSYSMSDVYGNDQKYSLKMNINNNANLFGIDINQKTSFSININIENNVLVNLKDLHVNYQEQTISTENPVMAVSDMWKHNLEIEDYIKNQFTTVLKKKLAKDTIADNAYAILLTNPDTVYNFDQVQNISFSIKANDKISKSLGFTGTLDNQSIDIINSQVDLNKQKALADKINNSAIAKHLEVDIKNNQNNDDTNLSSEQIDDVNNQVNKILRPICDDYFATNFAGLKISDADYLIISEKLVPGDNIFNQKQGKAIDFEILPTSATTKFKENSKLSGIKIQIFGKNSAFTTKFWNLPTNFANDFDGIWLPDDKKNHYLQNGEHYYLQTQLLKELTSFGNNDSLFNTIKNNSYDVKNSSFTGNFIINGLLDDNPWIKPIEFDVSQISNPDKGINNLYDLITKTKNINLYTNVETGENLRTLNNVSINFYNSDTFNQDSLIYKFDLSKLFNNVAIRTSNLANLTFTTFNTDDIKYLQRN